MDVAEGTLADLLEVLSCDLTLEVIVSKILLDGALRVGREDTSGLSSDVPEFQTGLIVQLELNQALEVLDEFHIQASNPEVAVRPFYHFHNRSVCEFQSIGSELAVPEIHKQHSLLLL